MLTRRIDFPQNLVHAIELATDGELTTVDDSALKAIKALCKASSDSCSVAAELLIARFQNESLQVRLHALSVTEQLFARSRIFRRSFIGHLDEFLELAVGIRPSKPVPGPGELRARLQEEALELIDQWNEVWGSTFQQIRLAHHYLGSVLKLTFPNLRERRARSEAAARQASALEQEHLAVQFYQIQSEFKERVEEMDACLLQLETAYSLLHAVVSDGEEDWEDAAAQTSSDDEGDAAYGLPGYKSMDGRKQLERRVVSDSGMEAAREPEAAQPNPVVLDNLADLAKSVLAFLPILEEWLRVAVKVEAGSGRAMEEPSRDVVLAVAIQLRRRFREWQERLETLSLPQSRGMPAALAPAQQDELDQLFGSDSDTERSRGALPDARGPKPPGGGPQRERLGDGQAVIAERQTQRGIRRGHEQVPAAAAVAERGRSQQMDGVPAREVKDPAAYKERVARAPQLSLTGRIGMSAPAAQRLPQPPRGLQPAKLPDNVKKRLAEQAPKVEGGIHLLYWDSGMDSMLVNARNMEVQNHWGPVDASAQLPPERISQFFGQRASYYVPTQAKGRGTKEAAAGSAASGPPPTIQPTLSSSNEVAEASQPIKPGAGAPSAPKRTCISAAHLLSARLLSSSQGVTTVGTGPAVPRGTLLPSGRNQASNRKRDTVQGSLGERPGPSLVVAMAAEGASQENAHTLGNPSQRQGGGQPDPSRGAELAREDLPAEHRARLISQNEASGQANVRDGGMEAQGLTREDSGGPVSLGTVGDGLTQAQRDRAYNRAVLAAAEKGSVSAFDLLPSTSQGVRGGEKDASDTNKRNGSVGERLGKKLRWGRSQRR